MIHKTAIVSDSAIIGENVTVGAFSIIHDKVVIGEGSTIGNYCEIGVSSELAEGAPLFIGKNSLIRSHSIFYQGSFFGDSLVTGHRVTVREKVKAGINLQIGTQSDLQGDCQIGDYVRTQSNVYISKHAEIGSFVWIFPHVVLTNDPHPPSNYLVGCTIEDYVVIAAMALLLPGVTIGTGSLVAAYSLVSRDVLPNTVVGGSPAREICDISAIQLKNRCGESAYPWQRHFHRGYPEYIVKEWVEKYK